MPPPSPEPFPHQGTNLDPRRLDPADLAACRTLLRGGSRSFFAASLLLPRRVRDSASALYAFCRVADDEIDLDPAAPSRALGCLRERLDRAYAGEPMTTAADRALAGVVAAHAIPRALLDALLEGFLWDAEGRHYESLDDLLGYAARVAGSVGAMMALLMGTRDAASLARACDLGVAMQLSNIARDVGEDARRGRLYLPLAWLREAGIEPEAWLRAPAFSPALGGVVARVLAAADGLYARADDGIRRLPPSCRPGIFAARHLYAGIGHEVLRRGLDPVAGRAVVPPGRKLRLVGRAVLACAGRAGEGAGPPHPAAAFLVRASATPTAPEPALQGMEERVAWLVDLFQRLQQREHA